MTLLNESLCLCLQCDIKRENIKFAIDDFETTFSRRCYLRVSVEKKIPVVVDCPTSSRFSFALLVRCSERKASDALFYVLVQFFFDLAG